MGGMTTERALAARSLGYMVGFGNHVLFFFHWAPGSGPTFSPGPLPERFQNTLTRFSPSYPSVTISACPAPGPVSISFGVPRSYIKS